MRNQRQHGLGQTVQALAKSLQIYWEAYAFLGRLENNESSRLAAAELFQQIIVHHHFSHAPVGQAADEPGTAYVNFINLQSKSCGEEYAHGREDAQKPRLLLGIFHNNDRQPYLGVIFRRNALDKRALVFLASRRAVTAHLPVTMHRLDSTLWCRGM